MARLRFPSIKSVAEALRAINANVEDECDVRLQVYDDGDWAVRWGDPQYDQDLHGYWGVSCVPGVVKGVAKRFDSTSVARELIDQAKEHHADCS